MARMLHNSIRDVMQAITDVDHQRDEKGLAIEFNSLRDAMLQSHCAWQDLCTAVKKDNGSMDKVIEKFVDLAAVAVKAASELSQSNKVGSCNSN